MAVITTAIMASFAMAALYLALQGQRAKNLGNLATDATNAFGRINHAYQGG